MWAYITLALLGLLAGSIAKFLTPGDEKGGCLLTILLGIGGSYLGAYLSTLIPFFESEFGSFSIGGIISAVLGAMLLLFIYNRIVGKR